MTITEAQKFLDDYESRFGENLSDVLKSMPEPIQDVAFVNRVDRYITLYVKRTNPTFREERLAEEQKEAFYNAKLEQAFYWTRVGDFTTIVGINFDTNATISEDELLRRYLAPMARLELSVGGLLYRGGRTTWGDLSDF